MSSVSSFTPHIPFHISAPPNKTFFIRGLWTIISDFTFPSGAQASKFFVKYFQDNCKIFASLRSLTIRPQPNCLNFVGGSALSFSNVNWINDKTFEPQSGFVSLWPMRDPISQLHLPWPECKFHPWHSWARLIMLYNVCCAMIPSGHSHISHLSRTSCGRHMHIWSFKSFKWHLIIQIKKANTTIIVHAL